MGGVQLQVSDDNTFRAMATNGKTAIIAVGHCDDAKRYPNIPALESAPNGETQAIVPAAAWKKAFGEAKRVRRAGNSVLGNVATVMGEKVTTFASTDLERDCVSQPRNLEGKFPPVASVIPKEEEAVASFRITPKLLIDLLKAMHGINGDTDGGITIELHKGGRGMIALRSETAQVQLSAALVPLSVTVRESTPALPAPQ
jgi:hypothetical protein